MPKHSDEAKAHFRSLVKDAPGVEVKPMFGSLGAFVNGNMFAGLFGPNVGVKLDEAGLEELKALPGSGPFGPEGRPMGGYLSLPAQLDDASSPRGWTALATTSRPCRPRSRSRGADPSAVRRARGGRRGRVVKGWPPAQACSLRAEPSWARSAADRPECQPSASRAAPTLA